MRISTKGVGLRSAVAAAAALLALAAADGAAAATIAVPNNGDASAAGEALVAAVRSAKAGDDLVLAAGDYNVRSALDITANITISGPDSAPGARIRGGSLVEPSSITDRYDLVAVDTGVSLTLRHLALTGTGANGTAVDVLGTVALQDSVVGGNAGLGVAAQPESSVSVLDATISDNGSGLFVDGSARVSLASVTLAANRLGGIFDSSGGRVEIVDTIVAGNGSTAARVGDCERPIGSPDAPGSTATSIDGDGTCAAPIRADPRLGRLADNGGPTWTRSLAAGSPAIDAAGPGCAAADQRGAPRVGRCDIGAFEYGSTASQAPPSSSGGSGSGTQAPGGTGGSKPEKTETTKSRATLSGCGAIRIHGRAAGFRFRVGAHQQSGLVLFNDPARRVRFRATRLSAALVDVAGQSASLRGSAVLANGRRIGFTIRVFGRAGGRLRVALTNGYAASGRVVRGSLSITR